MVMKYKILRQCRNKLENGLKPLGVLIGAAEGSVRGSHDWIIFAFQNHSDCWVENGLKCEHVHMSRDQLVG